MTTDASSEHASSLGSLDYVAESDLDALKRRLGIVGDECDFDLLDSLDRAWQELDVHLSRFGLPRSPADSPLVREARMKLAAEKFIKWSLRPGARKHRIRAVRDRIIAFCEGLASREH